MRIAFIAPPRSNDGRFVEAEDCCFSLATARVLPAQLLACASEAQRMGHEVAFVDLTIDYPLTLGRFEVAVYSLGWLSCAEAYRTLSQVCPDIPQIVIAIPPGYADDYAQLKPTPFCIVYSEPEKVIASLPLNAAGLSKWRAEAQGIAWYDGNTLHHKEHLPTCLHELGSVDYSLVPAHHWQYYTSVVYQAARGCPYHCKFCVWGGSTVTDLAFRMRPAKQVAGDIEQIHKFVGTAEKRPTLYILCAQLTTSLSWLRDFCAAMGGMNWPFIANVNLREVTDEKLDLLRKAGACMISAGLENTSDTLLAMLAKPYTFDKALAGIRIISRSGIPCSLHIRSGFGETAEEVRESIQGLHQIAALGGAIKANLGPLIHYKGTILEREATYCLTPHPDYHNICYWWAEAPHEAWVEYACEMTRLHLSSRRSLRGYPAFFREAFSKRLQSS